MQNSFTKNTSNSTPQLFSNFKNDQLFVFSLLEFIRKSSLLSIASIPVSFCPEKRNLHL